MKGINATKEPPQANKQDVAPANNAGKEADIPHSEDKVIDKLLQKLKNVFIGKGKIKGQLAKITHKRRYHTSFATSTQNTLSHEEGCFKRAGKVESARYNRTSYRSAYPLDISHSMYTEERWRHTNLR